jgi:hypothetical protein
LAKAGLDRKGKLLIFGDYPPHPLHTRVVKWYIFKEKFPIWVCFGGPKNGSVGIFYGNLGYFAFIWYILWPLGRFCYLLVYSSRFGMLYKERSGIPAPHVATL